jgi:hypothetical protein
MPQNFIITNIMSSPQRLHYTMSLLQFVCHNNHSILFPLSYTWAGYMLRINSTTASHQSCTQVEVRAKQTASKYRLTVFSCMKCMSGCQICQNSSVPASENKKKKTVERQQKIHNVYWHTTMINRPNHLFSLNTSVPRTPVSFTPVILGHIKDCYTAISLWYLWIN